jgi:hypothetical protein
MRARALFATTAVGLALLVAPAGVASAATPAKPTILLGCDAAPSAAAPHLNSRLVISMDQLGAGVAVQVTAHFKSGNVMHHAYGSSVGKAAVAFDLRGAPKGKRVAVTVSAVKGDLGWTCGTSFIPR